MEPEGEEPMTFRFDPEKFTVKVGREDGQPEDIMTGQNVRVRYSTENNENVARSVRIETKGEETTG